jgi:hypothetical protein
MSSKQSNAAMIGFIGWALMFALLGTPTARAETQQSPAAPLVRKTDAHVHNYGDLNRACLSWTDQCRSCRRDDSGNPVCSNIGFACQPVEVRCLQTDAQQERL